MRIIFSLLLILALNIGMAFANPLEMMKNLQKMIPNTPSSPTQTQQTGPEPQDCYTMLINSPKQTVTEDFAKYVLAGAAIGAATGALVSEDKGKGMVMGAIAGAAGGLIAGRVANKDKISSKSRKDLLSSHQPPFFKLSEVAVMNKDGKKDITTFKKGDYVVILFKEEGLNEDESSPFNVKYIFNLYRNDEFLGTFSDTINLNQGEAIDYLYIPVCQKVLSGKYRLEILAISNGITETSELSWEVE